MYHPAGNIKVYRMCISDVDSDPHVSAAEEADDNKDGKEAGAKGSIVDITNTRRSSRIANLAKLTTSDQGKAALQFAMATHRKTGRKVKGEYVDTGTSKNVSYDRGSFITMDTTRAYEVLGVKNWR